MEIKDQPKTVIGEFQIGQDLRNVYRMDLVHGLHFDDHFSIHPNIKSVSGVQADASVYEGQWNLLFGPKAHVPKFMDQAYFIGAFQ